MARLFVDDLLAVTIGDLTPIRPDDYRQGVILTSKPFDAAVAYELNTHADPPLVVLSHGRVRSCALLDCRRWRPPRDNRLGLRWWFLDSDGRRCTKLFLVPDLRFDSRTALGLQQRSQHLSERKRVLLSRERIDRQLRAIAARSKMRRREERLWERYDRLGERLAGLDRRA